jgi:adenylate cyclase
MRSLERQLYAFDEYTLDLIRGCLRNAGGEIQLRPKSFELLRYLVQNAGRLISKDELVNAVWPNVIVGDDSLAQCMSELRNALEDRDRHIIKTVPRRGYLFAVPVSIVHGCTVNPLDLDQSLPGGAALPPERTIGEAKLTAEPITSTSQLATARAVNAAGYDIDVPVPMREEAASKLDDPLFAEIGYQVLNDNAHPLRTYRLAQEEPIMTTGPSLPLPDKPSIAVLAFANMSGNSEQEFISYGIAEDIITALSQYPSLFVISRNSCLSFNGPTVNVKQVGRALGVRYVLAGSLRKADDRLRINAQLIDAESGRHVWANHYDRNLPDIFVLQDEISEAVTTAIAPVIAGAEQQRAIRRRPENLDAWAAYQRGLWHLGRVTASDYALAQEFFQEAIVQDPTFGGGYRGIAFARFQEAAVFQTRSLPEAQISAETLARRAVALDGMDAEAYSCLGQALWARGELDGMLVEAKRALTISPNLALAHGVLGAALVFSGQPLEGIEALQISNRLDPRDYATLPLRLNQIALALYFSGEYEAAMNAAKTGIQSYPDFPLTYRWLAASLGQLGRSVEANKALERAMAIAPASFDMYVSHRVPWMRPEDHAHMLEGLRKAGWES